MTRPIYQQLVEAALEARGRAYAPYSDFLVGAAVLATGDELYSGCNVENASYGLTICAERVAACAAVSAGRQQIRAVAVAAEGGVTPCGACRQFLAEFNGEMDVLLVDPSKPREIEQLKLSTLLPRQFDLGDTP